jgi:hypothetical protein
MVCDIGGTPLECNYSWWKMSLSLSYITEKREGKTMDKTNKGGVKGRVGFFSYALMFGGLPLPAHTLTVWPTYICICSGQ